MLNLSESAFRKILIALGIYLVSLFAANTLGLKLMPFLFGTNLSVAVFSFPVIFLMTDVIGELYGKRIAKLFVLVGFIATALWIGYSFLSLALPWGERALWVHDSYNQVFGISIRIAIASIVAFVIAEYQDVLAFFFFKKNIGSKWFWLRSNLSNIWSQFLDTVLFMTIAFLSIPAIPFLADGYSVPALIAIIIPWWLYKIGMGFLYTPLSYVALRFLKDESKAV